MNMQAISSSTSTSLPIVSEQANRAQDRRDSMKQLSQSMQSGDLSGARSAYAGLVRNARPGATMQPGSPFAQLGKALATGDMSGAQTAWNTMVQNHDERTQSSDPISTTPTAPVSSTSGGSLSGSLNVTA